jgi:phosphopantothenoylcysteine decarboxylase / phosphopantothenate---cysteine ligase
MSESSRFVVLGVSGGIAAYKAVEVCRRLIDEGCHVAPILTQEATRFVGAITFSALASEPAQTELYDVKSRIPHTRLGQEAAVIVIAPATANVVAKIANGIADDLLTNTVLASRAQLILAPAMHTEMWENPAVKANIETLRSRDVIIVEPEAGRLAGGDVGVGRLADPERIVEEVRSALGSRVNDFAGRHVVVSAGGTREAIDPVRFLSNRSSGKQGHAIANAAARRGARVTLVTTASPQGVDQGIAIVGVDTAEEMDHAIREAAGDADVIIMAAAVADFRPVNPQDSKIKRDQGIPTIELEPTVDILARCVEQRQVGQVIVGFAAETNDALEHGRAKLERKGCDLLVVNDVSEPGIGFDYETNAVVILEAGEEDISTGLTSKDAVADALLDRVGRRLAH